MIAEGLVVASSPSWRTAQIGRPAPTKAKKICPLGRQPYAATMEDHGPNEVTRLLGDLSGGDADAAELLFPIIYEDLRRLAESFLRQERKGHTLQATALVHEAYLRLVNVKEDSISGRAHFFRLAARAMRRLLVDHARRRASIKRGSDPIFETQAHLNQVGIWGEQQILELDDALKTLAAVDERKAKLVELRFFGGLTIEEAAEALEVGHSTAERDWAFAKAWLAKELA
jgi:RNA polymerase sigma factor (TIGR02999 family)